MPAGRDIIDGLECVLSVYFSNVRHHNRAAFLLCDELCEVACRAKMRATHPNIGRIGFFQLLGHASVGLDPAVAGSLGETLNRNHETRNQMQHAVAAATVDDQHCADAILDVVSAMEHCFPGTLPLLSEGIRIALRVVRVHSTQGTHQQRAAFDEEMRKFKWNSPLKAATGITVPLPVGSRTYWGYVIMSNNAIISDILDRIGAP
jgi:hypothetical protein